MHPTLTILPMILAGDLPSFTDFDAEAVNSPPALGGPHQPTSLSIPTGGGIFVGGATLGLTEQPVVLFDDDDEYVSMNYSIPVQSATAVRVEATVSFDIWTTAYFMQTSSPSDGITTRLTVNSAGEIWAGAVQVGTYEAATPFRVRMDVYPVLGMWNVTIDPELDGFADDVPFTGLPLHAPASEVDWVGMSYNRLAGMPGNKMAYDDIYIGPLNIGSEYCDTAANSTGQVGLTFAIGSKVVDHGYLTLEALKLPPNEFGYFLASKSHGYNQNPGGSDGNLCLGGDIARFTKQIQNSGMQGAFGIRVDMTDIPTAVPSAILAGESWKFQCWHRDGMTSNFTIPIHMVFE